MRMARSTARNSQRLIFLMKREREKLNSILHRSSSRDKTRFCVNGKAKTPDAIAVIDAALMIESGGYQTFD
jgi:dephospho-CoA kinase